jgi:phasin family protein
LQYLELAMEAKAKRSGRATGMAEVRSEPADSSESAETLPVPAAPEPKWATRTAEDIGQAALVAWGESQAAAARGLDALNAEIGGLARAGIENATRTANRLLAVKTLPDIAEVAAGFTRSSFATAVESSARLSEIGAQMAAEVSTPFLEHFAKNWTKAGLLGG